MRLMMVEICDKRQRLGLAGGVKTPNPRPTQTRGKLIMR